MSESESKSTSTDQGGPPLSTKSHVLETGASMAQDFTPVKQICAHLNAFHVYADDPTRCVEANHYCAHVSEDVRQCLLYSSPSPNAKLLGIEYMISPRLYKTLPPEERALWHTHEYEVKSGMLIMPLPRTAPVPTAAWNAAETSEMRDVAPLYGKTYHFWQVDRGDAVPMGAPKLMGSFVSDETVKRACGEGGMEALCEERDRRFGVDFKEKRELRKEIEGVERHPDADAMWKQNK